MRRSLLLAAGLLALTCTGLVTETQALTIPKPDVAANQSLIEPVQYFSYCRRVRRACADRFGWYGFRYRRCVIVRGCA